MKTLIMKKKILLVLLAAFIVMQFFRIDTTNPTFEAKNDFIAMTNPPEEVTQILRAACYDCHSHETKYPWYSQVAPISWWVKHHIDEGKEHLNFSEWGTYSEKKADHKLEECAEEVEEGEMPLDSYTWVHGEAKLSIDQKETLEDFFNGLRTHESEEHED